ncbi:hypothetical protein AX15_003045 [Amanita polypyramis BW_CC]|nr:hypothetical protein AX15_003045 [Amanita polypyramis BW_CC]
MSKPRFLHRRAIIPIHPSPLAKQAAEKDADTPLPDLKNVQGDVYFIFPKRWQRFTFFKITNATQFRKDIDNYVPKITSSEQTVENLKKIHDNPGAGLDIVSSGIAFNKAGLNTMGIKDKLQDRHFDQGSLFNEKSQLGDMATYDDVFNGDGKNHGVILLTAGKQDTCDSKMKEIQNIFKDSIEVLITYVGRVRKGEAEHFGWKDGISQPAIKGIAQPKSGQRVVKPGVIILGYPGDPVYDNKDAVARPEFTKDGSFLVFRKLEQNVLYLEDYINKNWTTIPPDIAKKTGVPYLTEDDRKALFGARMVGRFKSGVPLARCPYVEDKKWLDPDKINDFDYTEIPGGCPFAAHVRKTAPRNLQPIVSKEYLDASVIVRAGIPYGKEISQEERDEWEKITDEKKKEDAISPRGLLFACYQSSISNGFVRQTIDFANNDFFPLSSLLPQKTGQDPIIGGPKPILGTTGTTKLSKDGEATLLLDNEKGEKYEVTGVAKKVNVSASSFEQKFFVTSRGGDYYFVPSIATVKSWGYISQQK